MINRRHIVKRQKHSSQKLDEQEYSHYAAGSLRPRAQAIFKETGPIGRRFASQIDKWACHFAYPRSGFG
jgi:hypothetical protein